MIDINYKSVTELVLGGLLLALLVGLGALAFRDWDAFKRLYFRIVVTCAIASMCIGLVFTFWTAYNSNRAMDGLIEFVAQGGDVPQIISDSFEQNEYLEEMALRVGAPVAILFFYVLTLYLFARPIPTKIEKLEQKIKANRTLLGVSLDTGPARTKQRKKDEQAIEKLEAELKELESDSSE